MTKAAPFAIISSLTVFLGCALLGATEARAVPYVVTIEPEGTDVVATSNAGGEFDFTNLPRLTGNNSNSPAFIRTTFGPGGEPSVQVFISTGPFDANQIPPDPLALDQGQPRPATISRASAEDL